ncbi:hypothetical protein [Streptomyces erythrochromogenes]|uniref:hypothetical protein n=1 Tax=Streptomyces erythrochromogenes TaxID=285574 RepID=UPI0036FF91CE
MSAREERSTLSSRTTSLYDYAVVRHGIEPDGRAPRDGYPIPGGLPGAAPRFTEATRTLAELLGPALDDPDPARAATHLDRQLPELGVHPHHVRHYLRRLPPPNEFAARALGRQLVRRATSPAALGVGIDLVSRFGGPEDVPCLPMLALLQGFLRPVVHALSALRCDTAVLIHLADLQAEDDHDVLIDELASRDDPVARQWLLNAPLRSGTSSSRARHIAVVVRLAELMEHEHFDASLLPQAGRLLTRMTSETGSPADILAYEPAISVYEAVVRRAAQLPPTLDHHAILLSLALDLSSGSPLLLDWRPGLLEELLDRLDSLLSTPAWAAVPNGHLPPRDRYRADWILRMRREPFDRTAPNGLRIHVVERDPELGDRVETRILLDGLPLVPRVFPEGFSESPERILDLDVLRATPEERDMTLSTAYCSDRCCGTLSVNVQRDGDHVVWHGRHQDGIGPRLPEHRFDAAAYDAEIERARTDDTWCRPARRTARLIAAGLRNRPELQARWNISTIRCGTVGAYEDTVDVDFCDDPGMSGGSVGEATHRIRFSWRLADDGRPPEERAAGALERFATTDPKTYAHVSGGNPECADSLEPHWPDAR